MRCDVCGSDNLEGAAYCEDCGAKLVVTAVPPVSAPPVQAPPAVVAPPVAVSAPSGATVQCPSCGAENPAGEAYCVDCGANLSGGAAPSAPPPVVSAPPPVSAPAAACARLELASGGKRFDLDKEITTMGRKSPVEQIEPDIDLTDDDPESYVSRRHAQIRRDESTYLFEDVGSSNGSFINNTKVNAGVEHPLKSGDRVRLGKTEFIFTEP